MKFANLATAAVFAAFLAAPIGSLALLGPHEWAEKIVTAEELGSPQLYGADDRYRDDVARRLVSNSPVGMDAISAKNSLDFKVFGFVNTPAVISGERGWLFFKPGFQDGQCMSDREAGVMLGQIEALRTIARGAGFDFRMSVSPDKEVVYPEKLGPAAEAAAGCKILSSRKWREMAKARGSSVIDHFEVMDHDFTDDLLYYKTDTHWNDLGKIKAFGQLVEEFTGRKVSGTAIPSKTVNQITDSPRNLLRIYHAEKRNIYDKYIEMNFPPVSKYKISGAIIIHDSFYGVSRDLVSRVFLEPVLFAYESSGIRRNFRDNLANSPRLVLANTVERSLERRLRTDLSWNGAVGKAFIEANEAVARECSMSNTPQDGLTLRNMTELAPGDFKAGADPQILVDLPDDGRPCVRILFETTARQPTFIYLPVRNPVNKIGRYTGGFSVMLSNEPGERDFWIVLPEDFAGTTLRIDPIAANGPVSRLKIQSGFLPSIETAAR